MESHMESHILSSNLKKSSPDPVQVKAMFFKFTSTSVEELQANQDEDEMLQVGQEA